MGATKSDEVALCSDICNGAKFMMQAYHKVVNKKEVIHSFLLITYVSFF